MGRERELNNPGQNDSAYLMVMWGHCPTYSTLYQHRAHSLPTSVHNRVNITKRIKTNTGCELNNPDQNDSAYLMVMWGNCLTYSTRISTGHILCLHQCTIGLISQNALRPIQVENWIILARMTQDIWWWCECTAQPTALISAQSLPRHKRVNITGCIETDTGSELNNPGLGDSAYLMVMWGNCLSYSTHISIVSAQAQEG
jgi:hypothetical protein